MESPSRMCSLLLILFIRGETSLTSPLKNLKIRQENAANYAGIIRALRGSEGGDSYESLLKTLQRLERETKKKADSDAGWAASWSGNQENGTTTSTTQITEDIAANSLPANTMPEFRLIVHPNVQAVAPEKRMKAIMEKLDANYGPKFIQESDVLRRQLDRMLSLQEAKSKTYMKLQQPVVDRFISRVSMYNPYVDSFPFLTGHSSLTNPFNPKGSDSIAFNMMYKINQAITLQKFSRILAEITLRAEEIIEATNACKRIRTFGGFLEYQLMRLPNENPITSAVRRLHDAINQVITPNQCRDPLEAGIIEDVECVKTKKLETPVLPLRISRKVVPSPKKAELQVDTLNPTKHLNPGLAPTAPSRRADGQERRTYRRKRRRMPRAEKEPPPPLRGNPGSCFSK